MELLRLAITFVISTSVGAVIKNVLIHNTDEVMSVGEKVLMGIGALVITSVVGDASADYVNEKIFKEKKEETKDE